MGLIKTMIAFLGGLKLLAWLPGLGVVGAFIKPVLEVVEAILKKTAEGVVVMFVNPATFLAVGLVAMFAFAYGAKTGGEAGAKRVAALHEERDTAYASANERAKEAMEARRAAEAAEAALSAVQPKLAPSKSGNPRPRSSGVRKPKDEPADDRPWMFGVPAVDFPGF